VKRGNSRGNLGGARNVEIASPSAHNDKGEGLAMTGRSYSTISYLSLDYLFHQLAAFSLPQYQDIGSS